MGGKMKVKNYIQLLGLKQLQISKETGICPSSLNRFLNGWAELNEHQLVNLAKNLGLSVNEVKSNCIDGSAK
jgi:predicted XRE-type DNA-binding protein